MGAGGTGAACAGDADCAGGADWDGDDALMVHIVLEEGTDIDQVTGEEIQAIKNTMASMEPFSTIYNEAVTGQPVRTSASVA